jgi:hypothetical protein
MPNQNDHPAPETQDARSARHLAMLAELGELTLRVRRKPSPDPAAQDDLSLISQRFASGAKT